MKKTAITSAIGLALLSASITASANQTLDDRVGIRFGPFFPSIDTTIKVGNEEQNFENFLDDSATTGAIDVAWRISKHFRADFNYWAVNRDDTTSLDQSMPIGPINVPAGTSIGASFDSSMLSAALGWSFVATDTTEFGARLGISFLSLKSELGASVPGVGNASFTAFDETYPLPIIGVYLTQALSDKWSFTADIGGVGLSIGDDFEGTIIKALGGVEFRPWQNVGFGLAYMYNDADATLNNVGNDKGLDVKWNYAGPFAFMTLGFGSVN
jgi:opacity protein-like surface antigen